MVFQWNTWNVAHIANHTVMPEEAQELVERARPPFPRSIAEEKLLVWGQTTAGRYLQVIFVFLSDDQVDFLSLSPVDRIRFESGEPVGYVIHARDLTADEKRSYRRHTRRRRT